MVYDVTCRMIVNEQVCDAGWNVGDEIHFDAANCKLSLPGGPASLWALRDLSELMLELSHYTPAWAKIDENGDPYLTYRCTSIAPTWWEIRRVGEDRYLEPACSEEEFERKKEMLREIHRKTGAIVDKDRWEKSRY